MNTLKYKGYVGSVAYSEPDKVFFGKIEGIDGLVNYEGESVQELTSAFKEAVDDDLIFCEENNVKPQKSYTGTFNVRISPETHRIIANLATEAGISINAFVKKALCEAANKPPKEASPIPQEYSYQEPEPSMVMEPSHKYGSTNTIQLVIPQKDLEFAKEVTQRLGWKIK